MKTFRSRFTFYSTLAVSVVMLTSIFLVYQSSFKQLEKVLGERLESIVINTSRDISVFDHQLVWNKYLKREAGVEKTSSFLKLQATLREIKKRNNLSSEVYTLVNPSWAKDKVIFLAMSNEKPFIGNALQKKAWMNDVFEKGVVKHSKTYQDEEGQWISAMAPLFDLNGNVIAAVEVDFNIDKEVYALKMGYLKNLAIPFFIGVILAILLGSKLGHSLVEEIKNIAQITKMISQESYGFVIKENEENELTSLIQSINKMSLNLAEKEEKLEKVKMELVRKSRLASLGEVSSNIAHEINNPSSVIQSTLFILNKKIDEDKVDKEEIIKGLQRIKKMIERMNKIIAGFRKLSRVDNDSDFEHFSIDDLVNESIVLVENKLKHNGIELSFDKKGIEKDIFGNTIQLSQVIINMLNNSIYAIKDLESKWIKIESFIDESKTQIMITDSGGGIPEEIRAKIFEPFFSSKKIGDGTGIGMSISCEILLKHGGTIKIDSDCPNTRFIITIPHQSKEVVEAA